MLTLTGSSYSGESKFTLPEEGVYQAVCVCIADMGDVYSKTYDKTSRKLKICFEIPSLRESTDADAEAYTIWTKDYTQSLNEKADLRKFLKSWRGGKDFSDDDLKGFYIGKLLGAGCQLQIAHTEGKNGKTYADISAIMMLPKGVKVIPEHEPWAYDIEENPVEDASKLPVWIGDKIKATENYAHAVEKQRAEKAAAPAPAQLEDVTDTDQEELPF